MGICHPGSMDSKGKVLSSLLPTDPGNLLLVGSIQKTPLIGVPGGAKSIKRNGQTNKKSPS